MQYAPWGWSRRFSRTPLLFRFTLTVHRLKLTLKILKMESLTFQISTFSGETCPRALLASHALGAPKFEPPATEPYICPMHQWHWQRDEQCYSFQPLTVLIWCLWCILHGAQPHCWTFVYLPLWLLEPCHVSLQSRRISEHALNYWPPSWNGELKKPGMSTIERPRLWGCGKLGKVCTNHNGAENWMNLSVTRQKCLLCRLCHVSPVTYSAVVFHSCQHSQAQPTWWWNWRSCFWYGGHHNILLQVQKWKIPNIKWLDRTPCAIDGACNANEWCLQLLLCHAVQVHPSVSSKGMTGEVPGLVITKTYLVYHLALSICLRAYPWGE